jgi:phage-related protein
MATNDEPFAVELTRQAEKDLRKLRGKTEERAVAALLALEQDPLAGHRLTGAMSDVRSLEFSSVGGAYRAAYVVLVPERVCVVFMIGAHEGFYREAERRAVALQRQGKI